MSKTKTTRRSTGSTKIAAAEITTYPGALRYLRSSTNFERMRVVRYNEDHFKLDRMRALLEALGNPHEQVRMVHVAGTVGKGSTVAMIASMLQGSGYAVGQYSSPHLVDLRERIQINNRMIGKTEFSELTRQVADAAAKAKLEPTYFEILTAVAFRHFADEAVDIAVIETGLGGRLDSTNVITPEICIITRIAHDHAHLLGNTLAEIAGEKAGIFKRGVPAISCPQDEVVEKVLRDKAAEVDTPLQFIGTDIEFSCRFVASPDLGPHVRVCLITPTSEFMHLPVPLPGEHQGPNCALALAAIDMLKGCGFDFEEVPMYAGLAATKLPGRMDLVWDRPRILVDGAHNAESVKALVRCVGAHVPYDSMVVIFGCCEDKDVNAMLERIALGADKVIFTRARGNPRALEPHELQRRFKDVSGKMCQVASTVGEALQLASRAVGRDDLICVTGSFYLVGDALKHLEAIGRKTS